MLLGTLLTAGISATVGCPVSPADFLNAALQKLPAADVGAKSVLPAAVGPSNALFGVLMGDDSLAFALGSTDTNGNMLITAVAWYDADGHLMVQENIADGVTTLFGATTDGLTLDVRGQNPKITMLLNASSPPSKIVLSVQPDGSVTLDDSATVVSLTPNEDYNDQSARLRLDDRAFVRGKSRTDQAASVSCADVTNVIITVTLVACDIKTQITNGVPLKVLEAACISANGAIDLVRSVHSQSEDETVQRVLAGLKGGVQAACQIGQAAVNVASTVSKINPLDVACIVLGYAESGVTVLSGQSLATQICTIFTSDQVLGGAVTGDDLINLVLLDTAAEDGDAVAIRLNGQEVFRGTVLNAPQAVPINLYPGLNHFEFVALNEGSQPPNTARVIVRDVTGTDLNLTSYDLSTGQIATLDIIRK